MDDHTLKSDGALEMAEKKLEKAVFWGVILAFVAVVYWVLAGIFGQFP